MSAVAALKAIGRGRRQACLVREGQFPDVPLSANDAHPSVVMWAQEHTRIVGHRCEWADAGWSQGSCLTSTCDTYHVPVLDNEVDLRTVVDDVDACILMDQFGQYFPDRDPSGAFKPGGDSAPGSECGSEAGEPTPWVTLVGYL